jgi:hypothetical protein
LKEGYICSKKRCSGYKNISENFQFPKFFAPVARSHGLVVKAEDSQLSGCGFESWHLILDGCKRCKLLKMKNYEKKLAKWGTPNFEKKKICICD